MTSVRTSDVLFNMLSRIIIFYFLVKCSGAANILCIYPTPFHSHQIVQRILTEELARDGHQLTVLTTLPHKEPVPNITEIDVHELSYSLWDKGYDKAARTRNTYSIKESATFWKTVLTIMNPVLKLQFQHPQFQALVQNSSMKFDLILVEGTLPILSTIRTKFEAPVVLVGSMSISAEIYDFMGAETNHFFYPDFNTKFSWDSLFWDKLKSLYSLLKLKWSQRQISILAQGIMKETLNVQASAFEEMNKHIKMLFLNVHRFWDNNRPTPIGAVLQMGDINLETSERLPEDIRQFVDKSKHGVILMALGSKLKMSTLPKKTVKTIFDVFAKLPYDIIIKWDGDVMPSKPSNIRFEKWLPQLSLLQHPNVKAFVSHAGMQSTDEAIYAGVPMIGLPVFLDQWRNAYQCEKHEIGIRLNIDDLDEDEFRNAINEVIENKKYRENVGRLSRVMSEQRRRSGSGAAVRWLRHLLTHGGSHLRSPLADVTFIEFYMIDLVGIILTFVLVLIFTVILFVKRVIKLIKLHFGANDMSVNQATEKNKVR